ncbi:MAG: hypothetical protein ABI399_12025 [Bauldia sp.]
MDSTNRDERVEASLESIDESKRQTLRAMIRGTAFAVPVVTSFAIDGLSVNSALATPGNMTNKS